MFSILFKYSEDLQGFHRIVKEADGCSDNGNKMLGISISNDDSEKDMPTLPGTELEWLGDSIKSTLDLRLKKSFSERNRAF